MKRHTIAVAASVLTLASGSGVAWTGTGTTTASRRHGKRHGRRHARRG
jgi:hypothetical protein